LGSLAEELFGAGFVGVSSSGGKPPMSTRMLIEMVVVPTLRNVEETVRANVRGNVEMLWVDPDSRIQSVWLRIEVRDIDYLRADAGPSPHALEAEVCQALLSATRSLGSVAHCWAVILDGLDAYNV
jgi:hypothetical protein